MLEATQWGPACAGDEAQEGTALLRSHVAHHTPKQLDSVGRLAVAVAVAHIPEWRSAQRVGAKDQTVYCMVVQQGQADLPHITLD